MKHLFAIILISFFANCSSAQTTYYNQNGVAIGGYDPVAYFTDSAAVEGTKLFAYSWQGIEWHFRNQPSLDMFKAAPEKYAPQFGGYCAYGAMENHKAPTQPAAFTLIDNKLYLNYNLKVRSLWRKDTKGNIEKGNINWLTLKDQE